MKHSLFAILVVSGLGVAYASQPSKYVHTAKERAKAAQIVQGVIVREVDRSLQLAKVADTELAAARDALYKAEKYYEPSNGIVELKTKNVAKLKKAVTRLEAEKYAAEKAKQAALKVAEKASELEKKLGYDLAEAQKSAYTYKKLAIAKNEEARRARHAADQAKQLYGYNYDAQRLEREARYAEQLAAKANYDAKKYADIAADLQQRSTMAWLAASKATEDLQVKTAVYDAKCEALANTNAALTKAKEEEYAAKQKWGPAFKDIENKRKAVVVGTSKASEYWAVHEEFKAILPCVRGPRVGPRRGSGSDDDGGRRGGDDDDGGRRGGRRGGDDDDDDDGGRRGGRRGGDDDDDDGGRRGGRRGGEDDDDDGGRRGGRKGGDDDDDDGSGRRGGRRGGDDDDGGRRGGSRDDDDGGRRGGRRGGDDDDGGRRGGDDDDGGRRSGDDDNGGRRRVQSPYGSSGGKITGTKPAYRAYPHYYPPSPPRRRSRGGDDDSDEDDD